MAWIKRNLLFVVGLVVAFAVLGGGVLYLLGNLQDAEGVSAELTGKNETLDGLVKRPTYPNSKNIELVKGEQQRVESFKTSARARFGTIPKAESLNNAGFKSVLEATILNLTRNAERAGVKLPDKYDFTFSEQRRQLQLPEKALPSLALHLGDLADICQVLFDSKVHALNSLKRPQVASTDSNASNDFVSKKPATNSVVGASILPYEVSFECFSSELGAVLAGFLNANEAYIIKTINVEHGSGTETPGGQPESGAMPPPGAMDPRLAMMRRYGGMAPGLASRYGLAPGGAGPGGPQAVPVPPTPSPATKAGQTALEEKPLRVSIALEVVKLAAAAPVTAPAAAAPGRTPPKR
jgi:hypothetical protein